MCGIAGIWFNSDCDVEKDSIKLMTDSIIHRGPDGSGFWFSEYDNIQLGHRRLSIIDLTEAGNQPMEYNKKYVISFNGEIYNYIELREALKAQGYNFFSNTDTEVVLAAYDFWGVKCLQKFDGMFAFAVYNIKEKELFCARDRFGEKPFFYFKDKSRLLFASEMKALWAVGVKKEIDDYSMYLFLNMGLHEDPYDKTRTFYKEIIRLKPSHYFIYKEGKDIVQQRYWSINSKLKKSDISFEEACEKFRDMFFLSTERRLRSDVSVGTSLSGGLDSSSVVLTINKILNGQLNQKCFSARFNDAILDEGYFMKKVVDIASIDHIQTYPSAEGMIENLEKIAYHQEEPFSTASIYAQWEVFKLARKNGITVLLDGQGADEVLAGYTHFFSPFLKEILRSFGKKKFNEELFLIKQNNVFDSPFVVDSKFYIETYFPLIIKGLRASKQLLLGNSSLDNIHPELYNQFKHCSSPFIEHGNLDSSLLHYTFVSGLDKLLRFADRNSMAHSVEVRLPFLNHELVEFVFSLPSEYKIYQGWSKALLRFGLNNILPNEIAWRKNKLGFKPPQETWLQSKKWQDWAYFMHETAVQKKWIKKESKPTWESVNVGLFEHLVI